MVMCTHNDEWRSSWIHEVISRELPGLEEWRSEDLFQDDQQEQATEKACEEIHEDLGVVTPVKERESRVELASETEQKTKKRMRSDAPKIKKPLLPAIMIRVPRCCATARLTGLLKL